MHVRERAKEGESWPQQRSPRRTDDSHNVADVENGGGDDDDASNDNNYDGDGVDDDNDGGAGGGGDDDDDVNNLFSVGLGKTHKRIIDSVYIMPSCLLISIC